MESAVVRVDDDSSSAKARLVKVGAADREESPTDGHELQRMSDDTNASGGEDQIESGMHDELGMGVEYKLSRNRLGVQGHQDAEDTDLLPCHVPQDLDGAAINAIASSVLEDKELKNLLHSLSPKVVPEESNTLQANQVELGAGAAPLRHVTLPAAMSQQTGKGMMVELDWQMQEFDGVAISKRTSTTHTCAVPSIATRSMQDRAHHKPPRKDARTPCSPTLPDLLPRVIKMAEFRDALAVSRVNDLPHRQADRAEKIFEFNDMPQLQTEERVSSEVAAPQRGASSGLLTSSPSPCPHPGTHDAQDPEAPQLCFECSSQELSCSWFLVVQDDPRACTRCGSRQRGLWVKSAVWECQETWEIYEEQGDYLEQEVQRPEPSVIKRVMTRTQARDIWQASDQHNAFRPLQVSKTPETSRQKARVLTPMFKKNLLEEKHRTTDDDVKAADQVKTLAYDVLIALKEKQRTEELLKAETEIMQAWDLNAEDGLPAEFSTPRVQIAEQDEWRVGNKQSADFSERVYAPVAVQAEIHELTRELETASVTPCRRQTKWYWLQCFDMSMCSVDRATRLCASDESCTDYSKMMMMSL